MIKPTTDFDQYHMTLKYRDQVTGTLEIAKLQ
jgi:hypothetical protein